MAGVGVREQWELSKFLARHGQQRPICMQQLSLNGSLLLAKNHNAAWLYHLSQVLQRPVSSWRHYTQILLSFPGPVARRALWRASNNWLQDAYDSFPQVAELQLRYGYQGQEELNNYLAILETTALQLEALRWCEEGRRREPLQIMDLAASLQLST